MLSYSAPILFDGEYVVEIYISGALWDHRSFPSLALAEAFLADPLADDRKANQRATARRQAALEASIPYYAADYVRISKGRRVGRKPNAA